MVRQTMIAAAVLAILSTITGCGGPKMPDVVPVTGTVTMGGKPVEGATVTFMAKGAPRVSSGTTDAQGKFSLSTYEPNDGAIPGENSITVTKFVKAADDAPDAQPKNELPSKFASVMTSGLKREVKEGEANDFTIDLK